MQTIDIRNKDLLEVLNDWLWMYDNRAEIAKHYRLDGSGFRTFEKQHYDYWTNAAYLKYIMDKGRDHDGYPESAQSFNLRPDQTVLREGGPGYWQEQVNKYNQLNIDMSSAFSVRFNALACMYPPGGWIAWHNNANATAYNLIFTWSEKGTGSFDYYDWKTNKVISLQDKPGWQCKYGYFGHYGEPQDKLVYHCAKTDCWRMTVSYIFKYGDDPESKAMRDLVLEEISTE
jgi:hypothetical protein